MPSTLGGQHGARRLLEVQELLQEEDGLHGGENGSKKAKGRTQRSDCFPLCTPRDHSTARAGLRVCQRRGLHTSRFMLRVWLSGKRPRLLGALSTPRSLLPLATSSEGMGGSGPG